MTTPEDRDACEAERADQARAEKAAEMLEQIRDAYWARVERIAAHICAGMWAGDMCLSVNRSLAAVEEALKLVDEIERLKAEEDNQP